MKAGGKVLRRGLFVLIVIVPLVSQASVVDEQQAVYWVSGAGPFSVQKGEQLWQ